MRGKRAKHKHASGPAAKRGHFPSHFLLKLELESNPKALSLVRATIERATENLHFQPAESRAIVRSVDEALANVMRHAYKGEAGKPIEVVCSRLPNRRSKKDDDGLGIEILLRDSGVKIDPTKLKGRDLDDVRPGGLGLHIIRHSMDKVEFSRRRGQNQLRLVKYLDRANAAASAAQGD